MPTKKKWKRGKKEIPIDDKMRDQVKTLAGFGMKHEQIAVVMKMCQKTLERRFKPELRDGIEHANANVIKSLYRNAVENNNVAAQIFWAKARCGWKETTIVEGKGPVPLTLVLSDKYGGDENKTTQISITGD